MAITVDFGSFLTELKTVLEARPNLTGVTVYTVPVNQDSMPQEGIEITRVTGGHSFLAMSPSYRDDVEITGRVWAQAPDATLENGVASRDRAIALLDELATELQDNDSTLYTTGATNHAYLASYDWQSFVTDPPGYRSIIEFTIQVIDLTV